MTTCEALAIKTGFDLYCLGIAIGVLVGLVFPNVWACCGATKTHQQEKINPDSN